MRRNSWHQDDEDYRCEEEEQDPEDEGYVDEYDLGEGYVREEDYRRFLELSDFSG